MTQNLSYYFDLLNAEITQRQEEGCQTADFTTSLSHARNMEDLLSIYRQLKALNPKTGYDEPSDLDSIRAQRPDGPRKIQQTLSEDEIYVRILGGWLGRCAGCQLGKPVEGRSYTSIRDDLLRTKAWPLSDYFSLSSFDPETANQWPANNLGALRENLRLATRDDDQDYMVLAVETLKKFGGDFSISQIGQQWLSLLPYHQVYTAERQAYQNLVNGLEYPETAMNWNPYREWIGAQIRADVFGYVSPAWPEKAAGLAFRDAALSHTKNGIYGEMFVAAAIAAAFTTENIHECLELALTEIPRNSRYAQMVKDCFHWSTIYPEWEQARQAVENKYGHYHPVHVLNNAAVTLLALLYGKADFENSICLAVSAGWDTDCNGATAGSILGVLLSAKRLPDKWIKPLNDT